MFYSFSAYYYIKIESLFEPANLSGLLLRFKKTISTFDWTVPEEGHRIQTFKNSTTKGGH